MKKVILLAMFMPYMALGQIVENFETGNTVNWIESAHGHWNADTAQSLSGRYSLHHIFDNPDAGTDQIGVAIKDLHPGLGITKWSFVIKYGYDPSSLNNWSVFLMSDNGPESLSPESGAKGFAVGVNLTGSDDSLRLWKVNGSQITSVVNCRINWQTDIGPNSAVKITVERSLKGTWIVSVNRLAGSLIATDTGTDNQLFTVAWFGIYYKYSSTRDRLLWFDDLNIEGAFFSDNTAPVISMCNPSGKKSVEITLSEEPQDGALIPGNISLNSLENKAMSITRKPNLTWQIGFAEEFINRTENSLIIGKLCDISGNCSENVKTAFTPVWAERGDIAITEIMADPVPKVSLPESEYVEITNRTNIPFNLTNWKLQTTNQTALFPVIIIPPAGILIICASSDTSLFSKFGKTAGLKQFPSLTDAGRLLELTDSSGTLIHGVEYKSSWYQDDLKSDGGWSLEMVDTGFPFYDTGNWKASVSKKGGTPGGINSVQASNQDLYFSGIVNVFPEDSISILVSFSEPVFDLNNLMASIKLGDLLITDVHPADPLFRKFILHPANPIQKNKNYQIEMPADISDFAGNRISKSTFSFGLTGQATEGDILFNEILFNPLPGDPDYLEFYNSSDKVIDPSRLQVVNINDATGERSGAVKLSEEERCILPGEYYAITTDLKKTIDRYLSADRNYLFETESLPSMPDDRGHLILLSRELDRIDELVYDDNMHYSLLSSHEGVALEKTYPADKSEERASWHSATENAGWGTPGAHNSMYRELPSESDEVILSSSKITPDGDGYEDFLTIKMNPSGTGNVISITIYDEIGILVRKLAANTLAGAEASFIWDGTANDGTIINTGIYIVLITLFNDSGKTATWKKVCTVIRK